MINVQKSQVIFSGKIPASGWTPVTPGRPGSAGTQAIEGNVELYHTAPNDSSLLYPGGGAIAPTIDSRIDAWVDGDAVSDVMIAFFLSRATSPSNIPIPLAVAVGLLADIDTSIIIQGSFPANKPFASGVFATGVPGWKRYVIEVSDYGPGYRARSYIENNGILYLIADTVVVSADGLAVNSIAGYSGVMVQAAGVAGQRFRIDDFQHSDAPITFPAHIHDGPVTVGFESGWENEVMLTSGRMPSLPTTVAAARPGSTGANAMAVRVEPPSATSSFVRFPQMVVHDQQKDVQSEVWVRLPNVLPDAGHEVRLQMAISDFPASAGLLFSFDVVLVVDGAGAASLELRGVFEGIEVLTYASASVGTLAAGQWVGLRCLLQQFGLTVPSFVVDWNDNGAGWTNIPALSIQAPPFSNNIIGVDQGLKQFTVDPAVSNNYYESRYPPGRTITVQGSTGNDGTYTVVSAAPYPSGIITVAEPIPSAVADGVLIADIDPSDGVDNPILPTVEARVLTASNTPVGGFEFLIDDWTVQEV